MNREELLRRDAEIVRIINGEESLTGTAYDALLEEKALIETILMGMPCEKS